MNDPLQQAMQAFALENGVARAGVVFCAQALVFVLAALWLLICARRINRVSIAVLLRLAVLVALSLAAAKVLTHVVVDTRPYIVEHTQPLAPTSTDNGFPSDHTLLAAALTASLWWIDRRAIPLLAVGTLLVMLGRLGIEAHHTLDVAGSVAIVAVAALAVAALPVATSWRRPLFVRTPVQSAAAAITGRPSSAAERDVTGRH